MNYYEQIVDEGTSRFIGLCKLMTWVEWHLENYENAIKWGERGKNMKEKSSIDISYDCSHDLALALRDSGRHEEALTYFLLGNSLESLFADTKENDERDGAFWGNIARCLMFQGEYNCAIKCLQKSSRLLDKEQSATGLKNQGYASKWIAQCLEKCCKFDEAYIFYRKAKSIWDQRAPTLSRQINESLKSLEQSHQLHQVLNLGEKDIIRRCLIWINNDLPAYSNNDKNEKITQ